MDRVDVGILRWLLQGHQTAPFRPEVRPMVKALSKQLGVTGETVRNRMHRLSEAGVLNGVVLQPHPALLGRKVGAYGVFVPPAVSRHALARKLKLVEGMQIVATHQDGLIGLVFYHEGGASLERKLSLIREMAGVGDGFYTDVLFPPCRLELTPTDWRIVAALRPDASQSYHQLSTRLGVSSRTVKRRLDRMVKGGAVFTLGLHEVRASEGGLEANVIVFYGEGAERGKVDPRIIKELGENLIYAGVWSSYSVFAVWLPNVASGDDLAGRVRKLEGVRDAKASLFEERLELYECADEIIARKLEEVGAAPVAPPVTARGRA